MKCISTKIISCFLTKYIHSILELKSPGHWLCNFRGIGGIKVVSCESCHGSGDIRVVVLRRQDGNLLRNKDGLDLLKACLDKVLREQVPVKERKCSSFILNI